MFGRIYAGELKKLVRPKAMIILAAVLIVLLLAYAIIFNLIGDITTALENMAPGEDIPELMPSEKPISGEESVNMQIAYYEEEVKQLEKEYKEKNGYSVYSSLFSAKAQLTAYKFIRDNKLYDNEDVRFLGINYSIGITADGFANNYMAAVVSVMAIYAIVVGAGLLADEYKNGTIKLLLTRPISKNQLISAKLLAALTVSIGIASLFTFIGFIYGLIAFPAETTKEIYLVFNATSVTKSTVGAYLFGSYIMSILKIAVMCLISYFIGTFFRKKTTGIIVTIIVHLGIISGILGLLPVQIALLVPNMDLMGYFTANASVPIYGNFFISLAVYLFYVAATAFGLYFSYNKRDVI